MVRVGCGWVGGWLLGGVFHEKDSGGIKRENRKIHMEKINAYTYLIPYKESVRDIKLNCD